MGVPFLTVLYFRSGKFSPHIFYGRFTLILQYKNPMSESEAKFLYIYKKTKRKKK
jgi:hypothetical protein